MGDYFKKKEEEKEPEKEKLIEDFSECLVVFDGLDEKYQMMMDEAHPLIAPILLQLLGEGKGISDRGDIDIVRQGIRNNRFDQTTTGKKMWDILEKIDLLINWMERQREFQEKFIDSYKHLCNSTFEIVNKKEKDKEELQVKIDKMETYLEDMHEEKEKEEEEEREEERKLERPLSQDQTQEMWTIFTQKYLEFVNDPTPTRKGLIFRIARMEPRRRALIQEWFDNEQKKRLDNVSASTNSEKFKGVTDSVQNSEPRTKMTPK